MDEKLTNLNLKRRNFPMKKEIKTIEKDGYNGVYWPNPNGSKYCMIAMLGDDTKDMMAKGGVK